MVHVRTTGSRQLVEQRLCLVQIGGVEALGEPAVHGREQLLGFGALALFVPQPGEARRRAQLVGFSLLPSCDAQCLFERALGFFEPIEALQGDPFEAMELRLPLAITHLFSHRQPFSRRSKSCSRLPLPRQGLSQTSKAVGVIPKPGETAGEPGAEALDGRRQLTLRRQGGRRVGTAVPR
jgi:hypothetical protein